MEDEEDIYGFGALSDMFDNRSSTVSARDGAGLVSRADVEPKRLDVVAMSRFWWSERRLDEFRRGPQRRAKEYHHVAAKFDGMRVDGGLGSVFLVPRGRSESSGRVEDGGVLWIQAQASDSNAQARRKKEFQDITNRLPLLDRQDALKTPKGSSKSTATVFLSTTEILDAKETRVQNTMQGITFTLRSGPQFEITFMPGPFFDARNRDEVLEAFNRQQVDDVFSPESSPQSIIVRQPSLQNSHAPSSPNAPRSQPSSREQTPENVLTDALTSVTPPIVQDPDSLREANRELVRRYVQLEKGSTEAIAIAQKIYSSSHYHVGPLASRIPDFSADLAYRKRTCIELDRKIKKLTRDWALSEQERELHTRARCGKSRDDVLQYTDTITRQPLSSSLYRERYINFVEAEHPESHSVIRMVEPRIVASNVSSNQQESPLYPESCGRSGAPPQVRPASPATSSNEECRLFGIDIRHSALVDPALILKWQSIPLPACEDFAEWRDLVSESALSKASFSFGARVAEMIKRQPVKPTGQIAPTTDSTSSDDDQLRRRSTSRRRSLDQVNLEDVRAHFGVPPAQGSSDLSSPSNAKRRRSDGDTSATAGRRRRRQSLVGSLNTSLLEEGKAEESSPSSSHGVQPMDSVCPLCCDADAVVVMKPCGHSVCRACWGRLVRVDDASPRDGVDTRQCPWDRAHVIQQEARPPSTSHVKSSR